MLISTKGRYALRVMIDLAERKEDAYIPLKDIAERQGISEKYLESIVSLLSRNGLVDALRGKGGGYRLNKRPEDYSVLEILKCTEGTLAPVSCLEGANNTCKRLKDCRTVSMWDEVYHLLQDYFEKKKLSDLIREEGSFDFVI